MVRALAVTSRHHAVEEAHIARLAANGGASCHSSSVPRAHMDRRTRCLRLDECRGDARRNEPWITPRSIRITPSAGPANTVSTDQRDPKTATPPAGSCGRPVPRPRRGRRAGSIGLTGAGSCSAPTCVSRGARPDCHAPPTWLVNAGRRHSRSTPPRSVIPSDTPTSRSGTRTALRCACGAGTAAALIMHLHAGLLGAASRSSWLCQSFARQARVLRPVHTHPHAGVDECDRGLTALESPPSRTVIGR